MKSRSHRLPAANPQDDWVDGSWTVDCVCGVNFDDGEEMVNCDDCGVWVHTRCVRYVKSEKLFACDKCKNKARRNDSEETEVAQLLVELPTKTLRMNPPYPNTVTTRRPFRLWTDLPMEERVHVQGVPGGDPALFSGLSSVFGRELWKCSGYAPQKFNFQYKEFPCWDDETREAHDNTCDKGHEMTTSNGAGALFSLSRENRLFAPVVNPVSEKPVIKSNGAMDSVATTRSTYDVKKGTGLLGPSLIQGNKRKKEEFGMSKDQSGKKKSKIVEKEGYLKKDAHASRPEAPWLSRQIFGEQNLKIHGKFWLLLTLWKDLVYWTMTLQAILTFQLQMSAFQKLHLMMYLNAAQQVKHIPGKTKLETTFLLGLRTLLWRIMEQQQI